MNENILKIPLNPEGAISLGLSPCEGCRVGWVSYSNLGSKSCQDTCRYWKEYSKSHSTKPKH